MLVEQGLTLTGFGVAFGARVVLRAVNLELAAQSVSVLVGPVASGKSTLLRTLAGLNHAQPELELTGRCEWNGYSIFPASANSPAPGDVNTALVMQKAKFFVDTIRETLVSALPNRAALDHAAQSATVLRLLEAGGLDHLGAQLEREVVDLSHATQRHLAIVRAIASDPQILLADEPTAGLDRAEALPILATLRAEAARRCVIFVTHNQDHAQRAGGTTHLLVDGEIAESTPTGQFFDLPRTPRGQTFVRSGGCAGSKADADVQTQTSASDNGADSRWSWPRGFVWLAKGVGGLPRPGLLGDLEQDLLGLSRLGVRVLIGLEEVVAVPLERLAAHGLDFVHFPTPDMQAPDIQAALRLCEAVEQYIAAGAPVAFHCRAGLGRTGTMLACQLLWRGRGLAEAIETVRGLNPLFIQSTSQVAFLRHFELSRLAA